MELWNRIMWKLKPSLQNSWNSQAKIVQRDYVSMVFYIDIFYILSKSICKKDQGSNDPVFKSDIMENNFF